MTQEVLDVSKTRPVVFDGAMGTEIQRRLGEFAQTARRDKPNEAFVLEKPDLIYEIHCAYFQAGCDIVETNTFGANAVVLSEYGLAREVFDINVQAAELARRAAKEFSSKDWPRFVSGSVGPGTRLPSLGQIAFADLYEAYRTQVLGLLKGGVDCIQVETCQDPIQAKAAVIAASDAMDQAGRRVPIFCQVTFEASGKMLLGTDPFAAVVTLAGLRPVAVFGMNCSVGPDSMLRVLRELVGICPKPLAVLPNAGLPEEKEGRLVYPLGPDEFAKAMRSFVTEFGVTFVGGCCGTTPDHIRALAEALRGVERRQIQAVMPAAASSLFTGTTFEQQPKPMIVGERTNAQGSRAFRACLTGGDIDGMLEIARSQAAEGAHALDVSVAVVGRDEASDMAALVAALRGVLEIPLVIDSTHVGAIKAALEAWPGRAIVNSVNLEDGGAKLDQIAAEAMRHGAAIVALCIDESGMCLTAERKVECAKRLVERLVDKHGFLPQAIFLDPLTFSLASGDPGLASSARETIEAIRRIKAEIPDVFTWLGISNVSFGLAPGLRRVLNSVFLAMAVEAGLDAAILNAGKVLPLNIIPDDLRDACKALILNEMGAGENPLERLLRLWNRHAGSESQFFEGAYEARPVEERVRKRILAGEGGGIEKDLVEALKAQSAVDIINNILLPAMQEVGERFSRGEMQLPFVLKSAEAMKAAMRCLEPYLQGQKGASLGTLVLATVRGDVHDIGKNLVDIILSNNGFRVVNLGTKQPIEAILEAAVREKADAIGLSGLLVQSVMVMRDDLKEMARQGYTLPVLVGGAALTRRFAEEVLAKEYGGPVIYCRDAFEGLEAMRAIVQAQAERVRVRGREGVEKVEVTHQDKVPPVTFFDVPRPEFVGTRVERQISVAEIVPYVSRISLFKRQWQHRRGKRTEAEWQKEAKEKLEPLLQELAEKYEREGVLRPAAIVGIFPACSEGEYLVVFDEAGGREAARFWLPRIKGRSLADYVLPSSSGRLDFVGCQVVTIGAEVAKREAQLFQSGKYLDYFYLHGLAVEMTEAVAEWAHARLRVALGISAEDDADPQKVIRGAYRGLRFSFGYPACPDLRAQGLLLELLQADRIGVSLTEGFQLIPELSTAAIVLHHPHASFG